MRKKSLIESYRIVTCKWLDQLKKFFNNHRKDQISSVADPWHFGLDPELELDPYVEDPDSDPQQWI